MHSPARKFSFQRVPRPVMFIYEAAYRGVRVGIVTESLRHFPWMQRRGHTDPRWGTPFSSNNYRRSLRNPCIIVTCVIARWFTSGRVAVSRPIPRIYPRTYIFSNYLLDSSVSRLILRLRARYSYSSLLLTCQFLVDPIVYASKNLFARSLSSFSLNEWRKHERCYRNLPIEFRFPRRIRIIHGKRDIFHARSFYRFYIFIFFRYPYIFNRSDALRNPREIAKSSWKRTKSQRRPFNDGRAKSRLDESWNCNKAASKVSCAPASARITHSVSRGIITGCF